MVLGGVIRVGNWSGRWRPVIVRRSDCVLLRLSVIDMVRVVGVWNECWGEVSVCGRGLGVGSSGGRSFARVCMMGDRANDGE